MRVRSREESLSLDKTAAYTSNLGLHLVRYWEENSDILYVLLISVVPDQIPKRNNLTGCASKTSEDLKSPGKTFQPRNCLDQVGLLLGLLRLPWWFEWEVFPTDLVIWICASQPVALLGTAMQSCNIWKPVTEGRFGVIKASYCFQFTHSASRLC